MPNPYAIDLRERAVVAYESGEGSYATVAKHFSIGQRSVERWVARSRDTGSVAPLDRGGGWHSPVDLEMMHVVVREKPDRTTEELTRAYNRRVARLQRVHRSSLLRALRRTGYVFKKHVRGPQNRIGQMSKPSGARIAGGRRK